jgi:large subunit ribosomal protein L17
MRARRKGKKLGRKTSHRLSMLSNLVMSLFEHERIQTTVDRAKEAGRLADRMITLGKKGTLHDRRNASKVIHRNEILKKLFSDIAKRNEDRMSGHTRLLRLPARRGDGAAIAIWELVDATPFTDDVPEEAVTEELVETAKA